MQEVLKRYKRFMADSKIEHGRVLKECADAYAAYGNSIGGQDALDLEKVWGRTPPRSGSCSPTSTPSGAP